MNNMANNEIGLEKVPTFTCPSGAIPSLLKVVKTNPLHFRIQMKGFENIDIEPFIRFILSVMQYTGLLLCNEKARYFDRV